MFDDELYITVTGLSFYYNLKPFSVGSCLVLAKEPENIYDGEAIRVEMPMLGKVGYVANSPHTVASGCLSAGRLYDKMPEECVAMVRFMTQTKVIARVLPDKKLSVKVEITLEDQSVTPHEKSGILDGLFYMGNR